MDDAGRDILLARQGDERAYARIVREYGSMVRATCASFRPDGRDIEELVQDTFVTAFGAMDDLRDLDRFAGWLRQIAVNRCRDHARALRGVPTPVELPAGLPGHELAPDALVEANALHELVGIALAALPTPEREVVAARLRGDEHDEIAARLGIASQTSMNRLTRARKRLSHLRRRLLESAALATFLDRPRGPTPAVGAYLAGGALMNAKTIAFGSAAIAALVVGVGIALSPRSHEPVGPMRGGPTVESAPRPSAARSPAEVRVARQPTPTTYRTTAASPHPDAPLTYEEALVQRWLTFRKTSAFQELNDRLNVLMMQTYEMQPPDDLSKRWQDYQHDPFSIIGLNKHALYETATTGEIQELRAIADEEADALRAEMDACTAPLAANQEESNRLYEQVLRRLDMTREEHLLAIRRAPKPTPEQIVHDKRHWADTKRAAGMGHVVARFDIP